MKSINHRLWEWISTSSLPTVLHMDFAPAHTWRQSAAPPCPLHPSMQTMASPVQSIQRSTRKPMKPRPVSFQRKFLLFKVTLTSIMVIFLIFQVTTMIAASRWNKILHQHERSYQSYYWRKLLQIAIRGFLVFIGHLRKAAKFHHWFGLQQTLPRLSFNALWIWFSTSFAT